MHHPSPPAALEITVAPDADPHGPHSMYTPCVQASVIANPELDAALPGIGLTRRGNRSHAVSLTDAPPGLLRSLLWLLPRGAVYHEASASSTAVEFRHVSRWGNANLLAAAPTPSPTGAAAFSIPRELIRSLAANHLDEPLCAALPSCSDLPRKTRSASRSAPRPRTESIAVCTSIPAPRTFICCAPTAASILYSSSPSLRTAC